MEKVAKTAAGFIVNIQGELHPVTLHTDKGGSNLKEMTEFIGCRMVDCVDLDRNIDLWVDDEGAIVAEPEHNPVVSMMTGILSNYFRPIYGNGLFLGVDHNTGSSISLTAEQVERVETGYAAAYELVYG